MTIEQAQAVNRILWITDNPNIQADLLRSSERMRSCEIASAPQGEAGVRQVQLAAQAGKPYSLALVDLGQAPSWAGIQTVRRIWEIDADIQTILMIDISDEALQVARTLGESDRVAFLRKPFDTLIVEQLACALIAKWQLLQQNRSQLDERIAEIRATLEATSDGIVVVSQHVKIIDYNQNFIKIWKGLTWNGKEIEMILDNQEPSDLVAFIAANVLDSQAIRGVLENLVYHFGHHGFSELHLELRLKNGNFIELFTRPLFNNNVMIGRVLSFRDVTERAHFEKQLTFQATHDLLTRLPNRILLVDRITQAIFYAKRTKTLVAILYLDLNKFKLVNDSLGHNCGDELLKATAERFRKCIRESDTICRVGGDEFVFIIPGLLDESDAQPIIQKIHEAFAEPFQINNSPFSTSASIGASFYPQDGQNADTLLKHADTAMYAAKTSGKKQN